MDRAGDSAFSSHEKSLAGKHRNLKVVLVALAALPQNNLLGIPITQRKAKVEGGVRIDGKCPGILGTCFEPDGLAARGRTFAGFKLLRRSGGVGEGVLNCGAKGDKQCLRSVRECLET